jgi:PAS domain S-box-containing protein
MLGRQSPLQPVRAIRAERSRAVKIRTLLLLFLTACEAPLLVACAFIVYNAYDARRTLNEDHMLDTARVSIAVVEERLTVARSSLMALATSAAFAHGDLAAIYEQAVALSRLNGDADVILADRTGMQLVNSYRPFGSPPVQRANLDLVQRVFEHGEPVVSNLFRGAITQRYLVSVDVPVRRNGAVVYDLSMTLPAEAIQALIGADTLPAGWYATVLDRSGRAVARTVRPELYVGTMSSQPLRDEMATAPNGTLEVVNFEGTRALAVFSRGERFGWTVVLGVPKQAVIVETLLSLAWVLFGIGAFSLLALLGAFLLGRKLAEAIQRLVDPALALGHDEPVPTVHHRIHEIDLVAGALRNASMMLRQRAQDRDRARDALRDGEARFRDFAESASDWLWETDADGPVTYVSERFEAVTGMPRDYVIGKPRESYIDGQHPECELAAVTASVAAREPFIDRRLAMPVPDGRVLWFRVSGRPWISPNGEFLGYRGAATDITADVLAEERRQQAQKMAALGRLAGGIAHDFNNVLGAIAGFAQFLREDLPPHSEQHRFADRIAQAAARARSLIRQILSFARATPEQRRALPIAAVVRDMLPLLRAALPTTTRIDLAVSADDFWVDGNETELSQLLLNLCVNASDAFEGRYGTVRLRVERPDAAPAAPADGWFSVATADPAGVADAVWLVVEDDGPGMSHDVLRQVFEPFFTTKANGRGTGLGLAVVHGIVTSMHGAIAIASRREAGTCVRIALPTVPPGAAAVIEIDRPAARGAGLILLAEDDADVAAMTSAMLTRLGYRVQSFIDGGAALAAFGAEPAIWDLVLTDFAMPNTTGVELIRAVKLARPALPCVLITGYMENVTEQMARSEGADALLHKPIDQRAFADLVHDLIARAQADAPPPSATGSGAA